MTNKRWGRVGDSPIIGAGTYADNATCAVSATGHGEYFIRGVVAYDIAAMMQYKNIPLNEAADMVIHQKLTEMGGTGGVIALDRMGNIAMPFNTEGMYRGYVDRDGQLVVKIYKE
jgi:beta-aspartyl-peptidase (threonine type)